MGTHAETTEDEGSASQEKRIMGTHAETTEDEGSASQGCHEKHWEKQWKVKVPWETARGKNKNKREHIPEKWTRNWRRGIREAREMYNWRIVSCESWVQQNDKDLPGGHRRCRQQEKKEWMNNVGSTKKREKNRMENQGFTINHRKPEIAQKEWEHKGKQTLTKEHRKEYTLKIQRKGLGEHRAVFN